MKSSEFEGCQDHACLIQKPKQGTNGGRCRCSHAKIEAYINALKEERTLSETRERILRGGLEKIVSLDDDSRWPCEVNDYEQGIISGLEEAADVARATFKAAEEAK